MKFRAKTILIGGRSIGVIIPKAFFDNDLLLKDHDYEFAVSEIEPEKTDTSQN